jgi:hypothetical protein
MVVAFLRPNVRLAIGGQASDCRERRFVERRLAEGQTTLQQFVGNVAPLEA